VRGRVVVTVLAVADGDAATARRGEAVEVEAALDVETVMLARSLLPRSGERGARLALALVEKEEEEESAAVDLTFLSSRAFPSPDAPTPTSTPTFSLPSLRTAPLLLDAEAPSVASQKEENQLPDGFCLSVAVAPLTGARLGMRREEEPPGCAVRRGEPEERGVEARPAEADMLAAPAALAAPPAAAAEEEATGVKMRVSL
jgi:hypothetical protein